MPAPAIPMRPTRVADSGRWISAAPISVTAGVSMLPVPRSTLESVFAAQTVTAPAKDRKSTRLNSSHSQISYAVFCLKKKKKKQHKYYDLKIKILTQVYVT